MTFMFLNEPFLLQTQDYSTPILLHTPLVLGDLFHAGPSTALCTPPGKRLERPCCVFKVLREPSLHAEALAGGRRGERLEEDQGIVDVEQRLRRKLF